MTADTLFARLAGAWVAVDDSASHEPNGVTAHVADTSLDAVETAVHAALTPFLLGEGTIGSLQTTRTGTGWVVEAGDITITATSDRVEVSSQVDGWTLDSLVASSIATETARRLDAGIAGHESLPAAGKFENVDVVERIRAHARITPGRIAIRSVSATLDYADLIRAAEVRADELDASRAGQVVAVRFDRSIGSVVELLAALISGRAYLLLSSDDESGYARIASTIVSGQESASGEFDRTSASAAAYVQFTSGTSGKPKAIVVERAQLSAYCAFLEAEDLCGPGVTMPVLSAPEFDAIVKQIWGQLTAGGTVVLPESGDVLREIDRATAIDNVSINTVPAVWNQFLDVATQHPITTQGTLLLGGEALDPVLVDRTRALWPGVRVVNLYGPSECTSNATWLREVTRRRDRTPIGTAIRGSVAVVLDDLLTAVPVGAVGILHISGDSVARGYHGDTRRTAASFLPMAVDGGTGSGTRMYATGDRVRATSDGLVYLGRTDAEVKVNGVRTDLEALRNDVAVVPGVTRAAVVVADGGIEVVVECSPQERDEVVASVRERVDTTWRRELRTSRVRWVAEIPRTEVGKVDVSALARHADRPAVSEGLEPTAAAASSAAPHRVLETIWTSVLGSEPTRSSSIVALGGDSMKQLKIVALYRRILKVDVSLHDFKQRDTLGEHEDLLLERVDVAHLDRMAASLNGAKR
ncbi:non-ribosomal peptide synthetase [Rhodococcus sp. IEGM 1330]|uniref:non-ribosomal peptide synthetase n=1 Tax=Rhodococcus sp. IEGM 1330 TaxID=3082225 RepID=UPI002954EB38|nr:non-ribosomal peptide synthetase [Rhodococcus sp. IEGM 1330]MDV8023896.1 non-ribosomal peptide synthetase [Rhodococcus sp. IEGM 1330]